MVWDVKYEWKSISFGFGFEFNNSQIAISIRILISGKVLLRTSTLSTWMYNFKESKYLKLNVLSLICTFYIMFILNTYVEYSLMYKKIDKKKYITLHTAWYNSYIVLFYFSKFK